jgi:hypothetical protein
MLDQCYFTDGYFWQCVSATTPGQTPVTHPAKWRRVRWPSKWRWALAQLTYAHLLRLDGQTDKAAVESANARGREKIGLDDLVRAEANEEERRHGHGDRISPGRVGAGRSLNLPASVTLDDAYRLIGWDASQLDTRDVADARASLSLAVQEVWDAWWWQELMTCERRACGAIFNATSIYSAGYGVLSEPESAYYLCLRDGSIFIRPEAYPTNWRLYDSGDDPVEAAPWDATETYGQNAAATYLGVTYHSRGNGNLGQVPTSGGFWAPIPDWSPGFPYTNNADGLTVVGPYGPLRGVSRHDPRTQPNPEFFELLVAAEQTRVLGLDVALPWVWARRVTPILTGDPYATTASYTATAPENLVYDT